LLLEVVEVELVILAIVTVVVAVVLVVMPLALIQYLLDHHIRLLLELEDVEQLTLAHHMVEMLEALLALILLVGLVVVAVDLLATQQVDLVEPRPLVPVVVVELVLMQVVVMAE
jgi:flagellar biosynthesis protein FlhB|tara:strand:- start:65 stop:406 length:342 start_codon:yes stop_codon:yes gene_type:complete